ncbi:hypothetical protein BH24ACI5_BH24ACI5_22530 [soil metagenome]
MCGILAILDPFRAPARASTHALRGDHLLDQLAHRGPDGRSAVTSSRGWLGHRRLAIMDPAGGAQPFETSGVAWVANAEIFNHVELRARFGDGESRSDCAVIGPAWRHLGDAAPAALDGQFAWVCLEVATGRWMAARDHAGVCPLLLGTRHHALTFTIPEAMATIPAAVWHLESYQQVRTAVPTMILARRVREAGVTMVLSGEGADELLGGYLYFHSAPSAEEFHAETVRKTTRLHQYDVMRANKAPMAHGVELRFPFLDQAFMNVVMGTDPADRMIRRDLPGRRGIEKEILRLAFDAPGAPWLPTDVLWRQKEQFSDGVGYAWVDAVRAAAALQTSDAELERAAAAFEGDPPANAEMLWMRRLFEAAFVHGRMAGRSPLATVGTGRSIACSTPEAVAWNPRWERLAGDISGRAIADVHAAGRELALGQP